MVDDENGSSVFTLVHILLGVVVVLSLFGGIGTVAAEAPTDTNSQCPTTVPAYEKADETAFTNSWDGRLTALEASGCLAEFKKTHQLLAD